MKERVCVQCACREIERKSVCGEVERERERECVCVCVYEERKGVCRELER